MKTLPTEYNKNGYLFRQVIRDQDVAVYSQHIPETGQAIGFEVFEIIQRGETVIMGKAVAAGEAIPGNEQWGTKGYTVRSISEANQKAGILRENMRKRKIGQTCRL